MSKQAHLPDGTILEFPEDTPDDVMDSAVQAHIKTPASDSAIGGFLAGAVKPIDNLAAWASDIPVIGDAIDSASEALGMPKAREAAIQNDAYRAANTRTGWQGVGNFVGTLPTAYVPGGVLAQGAASGALLSDKGTLGGVANDAATGAIFSKLGEKALGALGSVIAPKLSPDIRRLADAGVKNFTPGQLLHDSKGLIGRTISKGEEALTSVPGLGDLINLAREGGTDSYERALGNRVLANINQTLPKAVGQGEEIVNYVRGKVGEAYDNLVPNLSMTFDNQFAQNLHDAGRMVTTLPDTVQKQFEGIVRNAFTNRVNGAGNGIAGQALKDAEGYLTKQIRTYMPKGGDHAVLAEALGSVRQALRDGISRTNAAFGDELQSLNKAWAQLRPMRAAAASNPAGQITPARMFQEARRSGFDDKLVKSGAKVMRNTTPDSGTAKRAMAAGAALTAGTGAGVAALGLPILGPAAAGALYLPRAIQVLNKIALAKRNQATQAVGDATRWIGEHAGAVVPAITKMF